MSSTLDRSDVPLVASHELLVPMQHFIDKERGLAMLNGISNAELREVDHAVWNALKGCTARRVAVLLPFRVLIQVFRTRRLAELFRRPCTSRRGCGNIEWGFNPLNFERALLDLLSRLDGGAARPDQRRSA